MDEYSSTTQPSDSAPESTQHSTSESKQPSQHPLEFVKEAQILLAYAAQQGIELRESVVSVIVNARYELEQDQWTAEREIEFWMAFDDLAKLVTPVSLASLKATRTYDTSSTHKGKSTANISKAERTVSFYQKWTLGVLVVLLVIQVYWLIGSVIITAVTEEIPKQIDTLQTRIQEVNERIEEAKQHNEKAEKSLIEVSSLLKDEKENLEDSQGAYYVSLKRWSNVLCLGIFCAADSDYITYGYIETRQAAQLVLQPIQLYLLPLLYGLLGSSTFVLRRITRAIRELTYTADTNARYRLRIQLGSLAGLAVGWFLFAPPEAPGAGALLTFKQLSPLAVSFLAGYSVELLFTAMDRLVSAFSGDSSSSKA